MAAPPLKIVDCKCRVAADYAKKPFVFELELVDLSSYLFQASGQDDMADWISAINRVAGGRGVFSSQRLSSLIFAAPSQAAPVARAPVAHPPQQVPHAAAVVHPPHVPVAAPAPVVQTSPVAANPIAPPVAVTKPAKAEAFDDGTAEASEKKKGGLFGFGKKKI